jgi:transposase
VPKRSSNPGHEASSGDAPRSELGLSGAALEVLPKKSRRKFSASEKLRIIKAADAALASGERGAVEKLLRREGVYSSHLSSWRQQLASHGATGLVSRKPGRKPKLDEKDRQLIAMTKRTAELERKLAIANALLELQKKAHAILGIALPESDGTS